MKRNIYWPKTILVLTLVLVIGLGAITGCSAKKEAVVDDNVKQGEKKYYEIRIPDIYTPASLYIPYVAAAKGFFEAEGIKPVFTGIIGPGQHVAAVIGGSNDVGTMHVNRTINGIVAGGKIKAVVAAEETSEEFPHMEYVTLENSSLKEPEDLIGKKIGVVALGGCNEYTPYEYLKKYTDITDPKGKVEFVIVPAGKEEQALRAGEVDVVGFHGHPADVFDRGGVRVFFDDYDVWGTVGGACPWYFHKDFIEKDPKAVRAFVTAIAKTVNWVNENREEAKQIHADWVDMDVEKVTIMNYAKDGIIKDDSIQLWIDTLVQYGEVKSAVPLEDIYTNEFNEFAKQ